MRTASKPLSDTHAVLWSQSEIEPGSDIPNYSIGIPGSPEINTFSDYEILLFLMQNLSRRKKYHKTDPDPQ